MLSHIIEHPENFERVAFLKPEYFFSVANQKIFAAILSLIEQGSAVELTSVATVLKDAGQLAAIGGTPYLAQLVSGIAATVRVEQHAQVVFEKWRLRQAIVTAQSASALALTGGITDVQGYIEATENELAALANLSRRRGLETAATILESQLVIIEDAHKRGGIVSGLPIGFKRLDELTGGWQDGDLTILAGRPGMGKTTAATSLILNITRPPPSDDLPLGCAFFTLEMPREQIVVRMACAEAHIDHTLVRKNALAQSDLDKLYDVQHAFKRFPLWVDDTPGISIAELRSRVRKLKAEIDQGNSAIPARRLGLVVVDYLQLMQGIRHNNDSREREVASISQGLKNLAKSERVPVLALSQLNRGVEKKGEDKRPQLSDLRESGAIEQDADNVWFLYRPGYYDKGVKASDAELIIAKQRLGPLDTANFFFDGAHARLYPMETDVEAYNDEMDYDHI